MEQLRSLLKTLTMQVGALCLDEMPDFGGILNTLDGISARAGELGASTLLNVTQAFRGYVEAMVLGQASSTRPLEQGLTLIQALMRHLETDTDFMFDISDVMEILGASVFTGDDHPEGTAERTDEETAGTTDVSAEILPLSEEDLEILSDFIIEAGDNLESIEIELVELEQDPSDREIINNIFRPFHTIKGVSGFLGLKKVNRLAHTTENLLDAARSGDFLIDNVATDAILESVDTLRKLLARVKEGVDQGRRPLDSDIDIEPLKDKLKELPSLLAEGRGAKLGEILVRRGVVDTDTVTEALAIQEMIPDKRLGEILVDDERADSKQVAAALMDQKTGTRPAATQVKVSTIKLDDLVDYAGELVIAQSMLRQRAAGDPVLVQSIGQLGQIVSNIQNIAMSMRMIPIKATFMKMIRLVRDLSRKSRKDVALIMEGEETEIDRNVVDALYEPMVHMIRNSVDHGIEPADDRKRAGKSVRGSIWLRAFHKGGNIIIEIEDDGKGLDRNRIFQKAVESGLVDADATLTDAQVYELILQPGFSTAKEITDVSGRGVGMDVVKSGIERFRGDLGISSRPGRGTRFTISLPLTLAIIDGMLVRVGQERYVIPTLVIQRSFRPEKEDCFTVKGKGEMIREREHLIPLVRMKQICGIEDDHRAPWEGLVVVVESKGEVRGLFIDELLGKDEYVIKSLGGSLEEIEGFSGGAILADGRVGLILDIYGIFDIASN